MLKLAASVSPPFGYGDACLLQVQQRAPPGRLFARVVGVRSRVNVLLRATIHALRWSRAY
jgi:hypothetical protein